MQQNPGRFQSLGAKNYSLAANILSLSRHSVHKSDSGRGVRRGIHIDTRHNCIRDQSGFACLERVLHCCERTAEERESAAAALARSAIVTGEPPVMVLGEDRGSSDGERAPELLRYLFPPMSLPARQFHRRQKTRVGQRVIVLGLPGDPDIVFDDVVVWLNLLVRERPVHTVSVAACRLKVQIAHTIALPAPNHRSSTNDAAALPREWLVRRSAIRVL